MSLKLSTGLAGGVLLTSSFKAQLAGSYGFLIEIYSGARPASADAAATGTLLATLSSDGAGAGCNLHTAVVNNTIAKLSSETWSGTVVADGVAGWFRIRQKTTDTGGISTVFPRIDGTVGTSGADMNLSYTNFVTGSPISCAAFVLTQPQG